MSPIPRLNCGSPPDAELSWIDNRIKPINEQIQPHIAQQRNFSPAKALIKGTITTVVWPKNDARALDTKRTPQLYKAPPMKLKTASSNATSQIDFSSPLLWDGDIVSGDE
mmetsp:Transcript_44342/g.125214  ORF Transcript_44342/g.125214 Transcript_44342/m.125214 type:complete len:110 (-) Transcript_44342:26-355(-)